MRARPAISPVIALALIVTILAVLWPRVPVTPLSSYDQRFYLGIAYDLRHSGRFTDGFSYAGGGPGDLRPPGMRFTPLYPGFLAAVAQFDPSLQRGIDCVERTAGGDPTCPRAAGSPQAGWIGLGLALVAAPLLLRSVDTLMTETMSLLLSTAFCTLSAEAAARRRPLWWLACGLALGLAILSRPAFLYLLWAGLGIGVLLGVRRPSRRLAVDLGAFAAGAGLPVLPWVLRNAWVLHRAALSFGYASHTLIQRIAFDAMTPRDYGLSFVCWLPDGSGLGKLLAGARACDRFGWDEHPDSFYSIGTGPLMRQSLAASGGWAHHMDYIVHHYLLAHPLKHLLVSIPLALRGLYVDHYWGLVLAPVSLFAMLRAVRAQDAGVLLLSAPAWFLLLFNALVAVNQPRYNLLLILPFSLAGAMLIERLLAKGVGARQLPKRKQFQGGE